LDGQGFRSMGGRDSYRRLVELAHTSMAISNTGHMICVMNDVPEGDRPYEMTLAHLTGSDKPFLGPVSSPEHLQNVSRSVREVYGRPIAATDCNLLHLINSTPPLCYKGNPLRCLRAAAFEGEGLIVTSYMMLGATGPVTAAGALAQGYAEVLVGLALSQLWRAGTPVVAGVFGTPFDMQQMVPSFGDPVTNLIQLYATALARRLGVPSRGDGGITSSKLDDAQAGYEGGRAMFYSRASGANFVLHSNGWLEQGRTTSFSKFRREADALAGTHAATPRQCDPPQEIDPQLVLELRARWNISV
jgi:trimethylamine--corrinoid protein Co-methyltransferase